VTNDDRLRAELTALERSAPTDLPPRPALPGRRRAPRLLVPATVTLAAGLLLGILGAQWLETLRPSGSTGPTGSGSASSSATPSTSPEAVALRWSVDAFLPESGAQPAAITDVDGRLIVTGSDQDGPAAWYSDDLGATWHRASVVGGGEDQRPTGLGTVAGNADRLLALGWVTLSANDGDRRTVLWTSTDFGRTWERHPDDGVPPRLHDLAVGGPGFVAVGNANLSNAGLPDVDPPHAAIWVSADGREWERLPDEAAFQLARMNAIAASDGVLVAAGAHRASEDDTPAIWRSSDGRRWSRVELSASPGAVENVVAGPDGFVAVGTAGQVATAWRSADGLAWTAETIDQTAGVTATGVAVNRLGIVAFGVSTRIIDVPGLVWFASAGGPASQQEVGTDLRDVVAVGDGFVGVGGCPPWGDCFSAYLVIARPVTAEADASTGPSGDLVGTLGGDRDLEAGCAWLTDTAGKQWEVFWPEGYRITFPAGRDPVLTGPGDEIVARAGDVVAVNGAPPSGVGSLCMVGELFEATELAGVQR
jgi:hypothetical protein